MDSFILGIYDLDPLKSISFSDYYRMKYCLLSGGVRVKELNKLTESKSKAEPHRGLIVGKFLHKLLEYITPEVYSADNRNMLIRRYYFSLIDKFNSDYKDPIYNCPISIEYWGEIGLALKFAINKAQQFSQSTGRVDREIKLYSKDEKLFGVIDELVFSSRGNALTEYKATLKYSNLASDKNVEQVLFYTFLFKENWGKYPEKLLLESLSGKSYEVVPNDEVVNSISSKAYNFMERVDRVFQKRLPIEGLCKPNELYCCHCKLRYCCPSLLSNDVDISLGQNNEVMVFKLSTVVDNNKMNCEVLAGTLPKVESIKVDLSNSKYTSNDFYLSKKYKLIGINYLTDHRMVLVGQHSVLLDEGDI